MRILLLVFSILYLAVFSAFGEENVLYFEIQQAKKSNVRFENAVLKKASANVAALSRFINPNEVYFFEKISLDTNNNNSKAMNLVMPLKNKNMVLELVEVPESFYDYEVITSDGKKYIANRDIKHYRGIVKDDTNSLAAITFYKNEIMGLVVNNDGKFNLVKDKQSGKHLLYNDQNLKEKSYPTCNTVDDLSFSYEPEVLSRQRSKLTEETIIQSRMINKDVRFYVETEYDIYQNLGGVSSVEIFISGLFNQVALLYQNEEILTMISCMYIWVSNDPYNGTTSGSLLSEFQNTRTSIIGDLGMLLTFRNSINGGKQGQAAGFNGLCNSSNAQKLSVSMLYEHCNIVSDFSWSIYVVAHEFGHLLGSRHTHACVWNGNNTAIDGCRTPEGNCSQPAIPSNGGTMMSYCHLQSVGIKFNLGFGPQPGNVIRNSVTNASCLQNCAPMNFVNQTVNSGLIINSCSDLNVQNVTVTPTGTLNLRAGGTITINPPFEAQAGSVLNFQTQ
jgi:hypothetical protein